MLARVLRPLRHQTFARYLYGPRTKHESDSEMIISQIRKMGLGLLPALALIASASAAHASTNLVQNGTFTQLKEANTSSQFGSAYSAQQVTGWTTGGYNFVFTPGTADTTGAASQFGSQLELWGTGNGGVNALAANPAGGNFIGADGAYEVSAISQTISGLKVGDQYTLSFYWATAQQYTYNGPTTDYWTASLGSQSFSTQVVNDANHGSTPWLLQTFTYTATSASEVLSFLATGTPSGFPPFALLAGVSLVDTTGVPEPATWTIVLMGLVGLGAGVRQRRQARRNSAK